MESMFDDYKEKEEVKSPQTVERAEVAAQTYDLFVECQTNRDRQQMLFRDRTLTDYINDNIKRFIQFKRRPDHKKAWQSNLASSTPNEKLIGILSKLATKGMEARVLSQKEVSMMEVMREKVFNTLLKSAAIKNNDDFQIILEMLEAYEKGTVIGFEDWYHGNRQIKEVIDQDPETGELKFEVKTIKEWNDVRSSLVNLEDFYPFSLYVRPGMIQDLDGCFLRSILSEAEFEAEFGMYKDADKVQCRSNLVNQSTPFWKQSPDVADDQIEVIRMFNKKTDEYIILANQIWINFIGKADISPLPWNHKKLPFWAAVFEPFDANFFYGRSLIDKLISFTDSKDALFDRILDQATLAVSRPIVTDGKAKSAMTRGFLQPSNVISTDWTNGRPNFEVVPIPEPSSAAIALYQVLQQNLERSTVSSEQIGGTSTDNKTATQANIEREGAMQLASLSLTMMEHGIREKNRLRFPNMIQFYSLPSNKDNKEARFKKIILRNEVLSNGKTGTVQVQITPDISQQRTEEMDQQVMGNTEFIEVTPSFIRDYDADIEIVPQSSIKMTESQRQILETNYQKVMNTLYPDLFNRDYGFETLNLVYDKDPMKAKAQVPQTIPGQPEMPAPIGQQIKPNMALTPALKI